jgi:hypothetical protein
MHYMPSAAWTTRLRDVFGAALADVTREHIEDLVTAEAREAPDLDFKATLYRKTPDQRRELCKDVAAMLNDRGGVIVLGVAEKDAVAVGCPEVRLSDAEERRMRQAVVSGTDPHAAFEIHRVLGKTKAKGFYLLVAQPSPFRPHAVLTRDKAFRYPRRDGADTRHLSEPEVADMYRDRFRGERQQLDRLETATTEVLATIKRGDTPWLVAALMPNLAGAMQISFAGKNAIEEWARSEHTSSDRIDGFYEATTPVAGVGVDRYTIVTVFDDPGQGPAHVYAECHTDGAAAAAVSLPRSYEPDSTTTVYANELIWCAVRALRIIGRHAIRAGASGDATVEIRLVGRDMSLGFRLEGFSQRLPHALTIPLAKSQHTLTLESLAGEPQQLFIAARIMLGQIFNAFGQAEVAHIADDGTLRLRYFGDSQLAEWAKARGVTTTNEQIAE